MYDILSLTKSQILTADMILHDSRRYQIFWEAVGLECGPLSLVSTTEELLGRNSSGSGLESLEYGRRDQLHWPCDILYPQKFVLTSLTSGGRSVGIVCSRTRATDFSLVMYKKYLYLIHDSHSPFHRKKSILGTNLDESDLYAH
jgi:hypothetical protein